MCSHYELSEAPRRLKAFFKLDTMPPAIAGAQVRPTDSALIIRQQLGHRLATPAVWGLLAPDSLPGETGERMFRLGPEAVAAPPKPWAALKRWPCLVPATAFYESLTPPDGSRSGFLRLTHRDGVPLAAAGLWESWRPPGSDQPINRYAIISAGSDRHAPGGQHRLPVMLDATAWEAWLAPKGDGFGLLQRLLRAGRDDWLTVEPACS